MTIVNWLFAALLVLQAHFAASYLVPLDGDAQREFGGLLRWVWPWSDGDSGLLGQVSMSADLPLTGLFLALIAATLFFCAALAVVEIRVPFGWWRILAGGGAILSLALMAGFFGATKVMPMALDVVVLWAIATDLLHPPG
ncbi:hypothetical protein [Natronolimnohabitans innermongolicus]|uniref:Uncharacterized protein n=1 Tax=Natronolimnohabitans innermongolicus JCM 12255 TaxID=1227499 RepID=L9XFW7_9EURY|nr:hypothetical protein [Natronolimnohabitans innermongolicus]ELY60629.1 hypothetical protein C493_04111 [Natronolimnohabitans innermongolicus JCM 12255]